MSKIISFAWTTPPLLANRKTRTRRQWDDNYAKSFKMGDVCQAYNRHPRFKGKKVATIKITGKKKEDISLMPDDDYEKEGFKYMEEQGLKVWGKDPRQAFEDWRNDGGIYWVVDFEVLETF